MLKLLTLGARMNAESEAQMPRDSKRVRGRLIREDEPLPWRRVIERPTYRPAGELIAPDRV